jgi:hypothetical protein
MRSCEGSARKVAPAGWTYQSAGGYPGAHMNERTMEKAMRSISCPLVPQLPRSTLLFGLAIWTAYWLRAGWTHMQAESIVVQNGFGGDGIQMWELFDLQMVAAHPLLRWLPGAVVLFGGWLWLRRRERRAMAARLETASDVEERSLAA